MVRMVSQGRITRSLMCGSRRRLRTCKFCMVPRGITPSSRRLYEAIAAKCVPVIISDRFVLPYSGSSTGASGGGVGLLPPHALDSFMLRVPEVEVSNLTVILEEAMDRYAAMLRALLAYRTAYLYELPLDGQPKAGGAVCAIIAEVARRFGPHLRSWRRSAEREDRPQNASN